MKYKVRGATSKLNVAIPQKYAELLGINKGDVVSIFLNKKNILITKEGK